MFVKTIQIGRPKMVQEHGPHSVYFNTGKMFTLFDSEIL